MPQSRRFLAGLIVGLAGLAPGVASAHFLALIPSLDLAERPTEQRITLDLRFTHPMTRGPLMDMAPPRRFEVLGPGGREDLLPALRQFRSSDARHYAVGYDFRRPGDYLFYVEPAPYWEPAEGRMIQHYTKVVVGAFGGETGWEARLDLPVEIAPLVRPYGLWTGNLFRAEVRLDGRLLPYAEVEVAWRNDGSFEPPAEVFHTQTLRADAGGVFAYAIPRAGWWGFAALVDRGNTLANPDGVDVPVESGALIWVFARDMR